MISKKIVSSIKLSLEKRDKARSRLFGATHGFGRQAKHIIFSVQRGEKSKALSDIKRLEKSLANLIKQAEKDGLREEGSLKAVVEEYLEAVYLVAALDGKSLPQKFPFSVKAEEQLGALSDLTGELVRSAVQEATKGDYKKIKIYRDATEELFGVLLMMNLSGSLRQKRDAAQRNLKRLEEILYDLSLKK